jgi:lysophospholipase
MAKKNKKSGRSKVEKDLRATVKKLRRRLDSAESAVERWRAKATKHKSRSAAAQAESEQLRERLDQAMAARPAQAPTKAAVKTPAKAAVKTPAKAAVKAPAKRATKPAAKPTARTTAKTSRRPAATRTGPDESWTLSALRAEARSRGLTGYSRESKARLLARLG